MLLVAACTTAETPNTVAVANNGTATTTAGTAVTITLAATDADTDDTLTFEIVANPTKGVLSSTANGDNLVIYTPNTGETGTDTFTFKANDGTADSNTATVTVTITEAAPTNNAPVATDVAASTAAETAVEITLTATDADSDALTYSIVDQPAAGTLGEVTGDKVTFTPAAGQTSATFTFKANDGTVDSNTATVTVTIASPGNNAPVATDGAASTATGAAVEVTLVATDADADALTYSIVAAPSNGTLGAVDADKVTYTPNAGFTGTDTFTFKANDGTDDSNTATVTVTVTGNVVIDGTTADFDAAIAGSAAGDVISIAAGTYSPVSTITLKEGQSLVGAGSGDVIINRPSGGGASIALANGVTISGVTLNHANAAGDATVDTGNGSGDSGIIGEDTVTGTITIDDVVIIRTGGYGIYFNEASPSGATSPGLLYDIVINNVTITSPGNTGILINDAGAVTINGSTVTGVPAKAAAAAPLDPVNGRGIQIESEYATTASLSGNTVSTTNSDTRAYYFFKNNAFGRGPATDNNMTITLEGNTATFAAASTLTVGYTVTMQNSSGFTDTSGTITATGSSAATNAESNLVNTDSGGAANANIVTTGLTINP